MEEHDDRARERVMRHRMLLFISILTIGAAGVCGAADVTPQTQPAIRILPASRGGQDLVGKPMPALRFDRWVNTEGNLPPDLSHSVTLYRWWTDTCPFC